MTVWRDDPERAADALVEASLGDLDLAPGCRLLLVNQAGRLPQVMTAAGFAVTVWNRRESSVSAASIAPVGSGFDVALVRMPKSKDELEMSAHLVAHVVRPGGRLIVYGGNDEGLRTAAARLTSLTAAVETLATRLHGRVFAFVRPNDAAIKASLADWKRTDASGWVSYPGLFARGAADDGTALLVSTLPTLIDTALKDALQAGAARVLDYGCGPGAIASAVRLMAPTAAIDALDNDRIALEAVRDNVPAVTPIAGFDLKLVAGRRYDLIVSNPPIHVGFKEDFTVLTRMIEDGAPLLAPGGVMLLVVQKRVAVEPMLAKLFQTVTVAADDGRFRVWQATAAKKSGAKLGTKLGTKTGAAQEATRKGRSVRGVGSKATSGSLASKNS
jgi:16S rRNA (guanine1207-N2)-methyltransferase